MERTLKTDLEASTKNGLNKKKIINYYINHGTSTITELAKCFELSVPTVAKMINEMCDEGYVVDYGKLETQSGRHPSIYGLKPDSGYFIGVDIRRFYLNIGLINFKGDMVKESLDIPYNFQNTPEALDELVRLVREFIDKSDFPKEKLINVCVAVSGRVNPEAGYSYSMFNFSERPLAEILSEKIGISVCIDNDTRVMTYGEYTQGCVNGERNVLFVNVGWGLGLGIIIDGKVFAGKSGFSGEMGHIYSYDNQMLCRCGKKGCLETEVSGSALHRRLIERVRAGESSVLSKKVKEKGDDLTLDEIIQAVNKEDVLCIDIVEDIGRELGKHIAGLINIFNPELLIIGGSLSQTGDYLTQPVLTSIKKYSLNLVNKDSVVRSSVLGKRAGMVGACMRARAQIVEV